MEHDCSKTTEGQLIAHGWRRDSPSKFNAWVRDDCEEQGVAHAASVCQLADGRWTGPACGPYGDGPFHDTLEEAKAAFDQVLSQHGWLLLDTLPDIFTNPENPYYVNLATVDT